MSQRCIYYFPLLLFTFTLFYYNTPSQASVKQTVRQTVTHRKRIVGVGDFHGDYPQAVRTLQLLQVIDEKHDWSGGNWTQFIHTGDVVDRGPDAIKLYNLLQKLEIQAPGQVHCLLGNHEIMNLAEDYRYVTKEDIATYGGNANRTKEWSHTGQLGKWLRSKSLVHQSGDYLFVHAGITQEFMTTVDEMNKQMHDIFAEATEPQDIHNYNLFGGDGPVWYRGYAQDPKACKQLRKVLEFYGAKRMISGHTPQQGRIGQMCGGRYLVIDLGISSAYYKGVGGIEFLEPLDIMEEWETWAVYEGRREKLKSVNVKKAKDA